MGGGGGGGGREGEGVARPRAPTLQKTEEAVDHRQNNSYVKAAGPRQCEAASVPRNCCFNCSAEQSHKDNVRSTAVEEQLKQKVVQLSEPSSTSQLLISPGLS